MLVQLPFRFRLTDWTTLVILGVGILVTVLVVGLMGLVGRWRRRRMGVHSMEEDLSWEDLLNLLRRRSEERRDAGLPPDDDVPAEDLLKELLAGLPARARRGPANPVDGRQYPAPGGVERRTGGRRWGNPTEVYVTSALWAGWVHGLVINRSTGGLALFLDREIPTEAQIKVRSIEAPVSVPGIEAAVRYCRKAGKNFLIGCEFAGEVPWNVRVWFG